MATIPDMKIKVEWEDGGECAVHSKFLLDWLESCGESWVTIIRCYDMYGKVYFRVKTCSRQQKEASRGCTLRDALQACVNQSNATGHGRGIPHTVDPVVRCPHCGASSDSFYQSGTVSPDDRTPRAPFVTRCAECSGIVTPNAALSGGGSRTLQGHCSPGGHNAD